MIILAAAIPLFAFFEILTINCKYRVEKKVLIRFRKDGVFITKEGFKLAPKGLLSCDFFLFFWVDQKGFVQISDRFSSPF